MPSARAILAGSLLLILPGCSKGLAGTYACTGMSDINALTLESNGTYASTGSISGHATPGAGKYTANAQQVTIEGTFRVEGLTIAEPTKVIFDRRSNGELKSLLTSCKKR
jgi:hypothetical protein